MGRKSKKKRDRNWIARNVHASDRPSEDQVVKAKATLLAMRPGKARRLLKSLGLK